MGNILKITCSHSLEDVEDLSILFSTAASPLQVTINSSCASPIDVLT